MVGWVGKFSQMMIRLFLSSSVASQLSATKRNKHAEDLQHRSYKSIGGVFCFHVHINDITYNHKIVVNQNLIEFN